MHATLEIQMGRIPKRLCTLITEDIICFLSCISLMCTTNKRIFTAYRRSTTSHILIDAEEEEEEGTVTDGSIKFQV